MSRKVYKAGNVEIETQGDRVLRMTHQPETTFVELIRHAEALEARAKEFRRAAGLAMRVID